MPVDWSGPLSFFDAFANRPTPVTERKGVLYFTTDTGQVFRTDGNTWTDITQAVLPQVNVMSYGAIGDGIADDTAAIGRAMTAAPAGSRIILPAGHTFLVSPSLQVNGAYGCLNPNKPLVLDYRGATIKIKDQTVVTSASTFLVYLSGSPAWFAILGLGGTLDVNGQNQTLAGMGSSINLCGISTRNTGQDTRLYLSSVRVSNASTKAGGSANFSGIAVDDYGCSQVVIDGSLEHEACDTGMWHTTLAPNSGLCHLHADKIIGHNTKLYGVNLEEAGQVYIGEVHTRLDAPANNVFSLAIFTGNTADVTDVHIGRVVSENCQNIATGVGGTFYLANSSIGPCQSKGAPQNSTFNITQVKPSVKFVDMIADSSNAGSILVIAGGDATHYPIFDAVHIAAPGAGASVSGSGGNTPFVINGGWVGGLINLPATLGPTAIRNVKGYNPTGFFGPPAMPASGVGLLNPLGVDVMIYLNGSVDTVQINGSGTGGPRQFVFLPAGATVTVFYSGVTPTWAWFGV